MAEIKNIEYGEYTEYVIDRIRVMYGICHGAFKDHIRPTPG